MTSDNSLLPILRRLDEMERKPDRMLEEDLQHARRHRLFGAPRQSPKEGLKQELAPGYAAALVAAMSKSLARMNKSLDSNNAT